jgi:hypothetical protein
MIRSKHTLLIALAFLSGCDFGFGPGLYDFKADLAGGYTLYRTSPDEIVIAGPSGDAIPTKVVEIAHDQKFILAKQQHLRRRTPGSETDTYEEPAPGEYSYWILNLAPTTIHGPLDAKQFMTKRLELKVDPSLSLRDVYDYAPTR